MAKVTGPLFSFSARGQLGKTLVYFPWKGINAVRSYVIPANPDTGGQQTQRGYLSLAVDHWHEDGLDALDVTAWNRYAATLASPQSGFNAFCKNYIDRRVEAISDAAFIENFNGGLVDDADGTFTGEVTEDGQATAVDMLWGTSPTALINVEAGTEVVNVWTFDPTSNVAGQNIYARFRFKTAAAVNGWSGIYHVLVA